MNSTEMRHFTKSISKIDPDSKATDLIELEESEFREYLSLVTQEKKVSINLLGAFRSAKRRVVQELQETQLAREKRVSEQQLDARKALLAIERDHAKMELEIQRDQFNTDIALRHPPNSRSKIDYDVVGMLFVASTTVLNLLQLLQSRRLSAAFALRAISLVLGIGFLVLRSKKWPKKAKYGPILALLINVEGFISTLYTGDYFEQTFHWPFFNVTYNNTH